jgi:hypothetical protein
MMKPFHCVTCGRPMFYSDPSRVCFPCFLRDARRQDDAFALGRIAMPWRKFWAELSANITRAFQERML